MGVIQTKTCRHVFFLFVFCFWWSEYLSDRSLRVEHEVAERSLENPSELCEEARIIGDGPRWCGALPDFSISNSLWDTQKVTSKEINSNIVSFHWKKVAHQVLAESVWSRNSFCILQQVFLQFLVWMLTDCLHLDKEAPFKSFKLWENIYFI